MLIGTDRVWYTEDFGRHWVTLPTGRPIARRRRQPTPGPRSASRSRSAGGRRPDVAWVLSGNELGAVRPRRRQPTRRRRSGHVEPRRDPRAGRRRTRRTTRRRTGRSATRPCGPTSPSTSTPAARSADRRAPSTSARSAIRRDDGRHAVVVRRHATRGTRPALRGGRRPGAGHGDPAATRPTPNDVYVGTTVGVWRGVRTWRSAPPDWDWERSSTACPRRRSRTSPSSTDGGAAAAAGGDRRARRLGAAPRRRRRRTSPTCGPTTTTCATAPRALENAARRHDGALVARQPRHPPAAAPRPRPGARRRCRGRTSARRPTEELRRFQAALRSQHRRPALPGHRHLGPATSTRCCATTARRRTASAGADDRVDAGVLDDSMMVAPARHRRAVGRRRCRPRPTCTSSRRRSPRATRRQPRCDAAAPSAAQGRRGRAPPRPRRRSPAPNVRVTLLRWLDPTRRERAVRTTRRPGSRATCRGRRRSTRCSTPRRRTVAGRRRRLVVRRHQRRHRAADPRRPDARQPDLRRRDVRPRPHRRPQQPVVLLVAVIRAGRAPATLAPRAPLRRPGAHNPHVAVRSLRVTT